MEQSVWDILITGGVLVGLALWIFAKVSHKTIPEMIKDWKETMQENGEEITGEALVWNE